MTGPSYTFAKDFSGVVRMNLTITDTVEYYKNANFGYAVEVSGDGNVWSVKGTSMSDGNITASFCNENSGVGYVDVNISSSTNSGTITVKNVLPSSEF